MHDGKSQNGGGVFCRERRVQCLDPRNILVLDLNNAYMEYSIYDHLPSCTSIICANFGTYATLQ